VITDVGRQNRNWK